MIDIDLILNVIRFVGSVGIDLGLTATDFVRHAESLTQIIRHISNLFRKTSNSQFRQISSEFRKQFYYLTQNNPNKKRTSAKRGSKETEAQRKSTTFGGRAGRAKKPRIRRWPFAASC